MTSNVTRTMPGEAIIKKEEIEAGLARCLAFVDQNRQRWSTGFPGPCSENGVYPTTINTSWTTSFWTGMLWLGYEYTGSPAYKEIAQQHTQSFAHRMEVMEDLDHHDIGFLYTLSCVADYKLTGSAFARETALKAADLLARRYYPASGIIQAWGALDDPENRGRIIVDCLMNLPLLYWAAAESGNRAYYDMAYSHAKKSAQYLIRQDDTTFHTFFFDVETGAPKFGKTHQGAFDDSCWARGQAWGVYGFPLSSCHTGDMAFLNEGRRLARYFMDNLPADGICYWDMYYKDGAYEPRDSSAMVIAACGVLEQLKLLPPTSEEAARGRCFVAATFKTLTQHYLAPPDQNGVLMHATYAKNPSNLGVDEFNIWGDYFYMELCMRLLDAWTPYW